MTCSSKMYMICRAISLSLRRDDDNTSYHGVGIARNNATRSCNPVHRRLWLSQLITVDANAARLTSYVFSIRPSSQHTLRRNPKKSAKKQHFWSAVGNKQETSRISRCESCRQDVRSWMVLRSRKLASCSSMDITRMFVVPSCYPDYRLVPSLPRRFRTQCTAGMVYECVELYLLQRWNILCSRQSCIWQTFDGIVSPRDMASVYSQYFTCTLATTI